jgi:hypothetical protein
MNKLSIIICLLAVTFFSCKKNNWEIVDQSQPSVPVIVSDLYGTYNGVPTVATSLSGGGSITITLNIPANSGRTIKEITRVGLGTVTNNYKVVQTTSGLYNTAAIRGSGTSVTFTTSLTEYTNKTGLAVTTGGTATSFLARYFYFLVTLDNGQEIIPVPVRVYVKS